MRNVSASENFIPFTIRVSRKDAKKSLKLAGVVFLGKIQLNGRSCNLSMNAPRSGAMMAHFVRNAADNVYE